MMRTILFITIIFFLLCGIGVYFLFNQGYLYAKEPEQEQNVFSILQSKCIDTCVGDERKLICMGETCYYACIGKRINTCSP